jgi:penicillin-binding protein 1C
LSLAIGGAEASPVEIAEGYATLARGGVFVPAHLVGAEAAGTRVIPERVCWQTLGCIDGRARTESVDGGVAAAALGAAWKTGTSNGLRDAWCAAVTPRLCVVVWLGNSGGRGDAALVGQDAAAPLALRLIGALDRGGARFPQGEREGKVPVLATASGLSIVTPAPGREFLLEEGATQRVALQSVGGEGTRRWWFANGSLVATSESGRTAWWSAAAGRYELRVVDESGHGRGVTVRVR